MTCEEVEFALATDALAAREDAAVRAHLDGCASCRGALRAFERLDAALLGATATGPRDRALFLDRLDARIDREAASRRGVRLPFRIAAAAAAIAVTAVLVARSRPDAPCDVAPCPPRAPEAVERAATTAELCARLRSANPAERAAALEEVGRRADAVSRTLLVAAIEDVALGGRAAALAGQARLREAIPALSRLARDPKRGDVAVEALASIGGREAAVVLLRHLTEGPHAEAAARGLRGLGPVARDVLRERVQRARPADHEDLLRAVTSLRVVECLGWVISIADRPGPFQAGAIEALGSLGDPRAVAALVRIAREPARRAEAISALKALGEPGARELGRLASAGRREDRVRAIGVLGEIGDASAVHILVAALSDPSLRSEAARALGGLGDASVAPALAACLEDPSARSAALEALERVADATTVPLLERLGQDPTLRRDAIRILGRTGAPEALPALVRALGARETAALATEGLAFLGEPAIPVLIRALSVRDVASRARRALVEIAAVDLGADPRAWQRWWMERRSSQNVSISSGAVPST